MDKRINIYARESLSYCLKECAKDENRSVSNFIDWLLMNYLQDKYGFHSVDEAYNWFKKHE